MSICKNISGLCLLFMVLSSSFLYSQKWLDMNNGLVCPGESMGMGFKFDVHPETQQIHVAGLFLKDFQCNELRSIAAWNGSEWIPYAQTNSASFKTLKFYQGKLYSISSLPGTGEFSFIQLDENNEWVTVSELTNNMALWQLREIDGYLYGAGSFSEHSNEPAALLFRWDGQTMEAVIDTLPTSLMHAYEVYKYKNDIYVGGRFSFNNEQVYDFGKVSNGRVEGFGVLRESAVYSMEEHEGLLYIGGAFQPEQFGLEYWTTLLVFDGATLQPYHFQPNDGVPRKLISYNGYLYVVGHFTEFNGEPAHGVVRLNQFGYEILNTDSMFSASGLPSHNLGNSINDAIILNDTLYITGQFARIGPYDSLNYVAKLNMALSASPKPLPIAGVTLYPNPSFDDVYLEAPEFFSVDALVRIFTVSGQLLRFEHWPAYTRRKKLERSGLTNGVYIVELLADDQRKSLRWIVID